MNPTIPIICAVIVVAALFLWLELVYRPQADRHDATIAKQRARAIAAQYTVCYLVPPSYRHECGGRVHESYYQIDGDTTMLEGSCDRCGYSHLVDYWETGVEQVAPIGRRHEALIEVAA